jgi:hypothetical protein
MAPYGMPPSLRPRKGTPEAIVLEELEYLTALREQTAANALPATAAEPEIQPSTEAPVQDPNPPQTSKEKRSMPATPSSRAKAALRNSKSRRRSKPQIAASDPALERHSRKCKICSHPDREAIEELFVNWHSPQSIRRDYAMHHPFDWCAVYRHARAAGLYAKRSRNLRAVLDLLLEGANNVPPTAHGVIAAIRAYSCLTEANQWVEPEKRVRIVNHVYRHLPAEAGVPAPPPPSPPENLAEPDSDAASKRPQNHSAVSVPANGSLHAASSLVTAHSPALRHEGPLPSNRQPTELESPPTRT